ncbi:hypothetical protein GCM10009636_23970 [Arthrobacter koreensis]
MNDGIATQDARHRTKAPTLFILCCRNAPLNLSDQRYCDTGSTPLAQSDCNATQDADPGQSPTTEPGPEESTGKPRAGATAAPPSRGRRPLPLSEALPRASTRVRLQHSWPEAS